MNLPVKWAIVPLLAVLALAACGTNHPAAHHAIHSTVPVAAAPLPAATYSPPPPPSMSQQISDWWNSGGSSDSAAITADTSALSADASAFDVAAVESDGSTLAADAMSAAADGAPGPMGVQWVKAMKDYERAGNLAAAGDFTDATTYIMRANAHINRATAAVKRAVG